jgi:hypothetical protein
MYNFSLPYRGDPLDLTMMSQMAQYIDEINSKLLENKSATSSLEAPVRLKVETDNLTVWTGKILVAQNIKPVSNINDLERINWYAPFDISFRSVPIVTATPFCNSTDGGTKSANTVWLHEVTTTGVRGKFKFTESPRQVEDVYVMIIAVGEGVV